MATPKDGAVLLLPAGPQGTDRVQAEQGCRVRVLEAHGGPSEAAELSCGLEKLETAERKPVVSGNYAGPGAMVSSPPEQKPVLGMNTNGGAGVPQLRGGVLRRLHAGSSCSEQVLSGERGGGEVQSQPKISEWERSFAAVADPVNLAAGGLGLGGDPLLQDILMYRGKPF